MNKIKITAVMLIWGSIGVFTRSIPLSALSLAFLRAVVALPILYIVIRKRNLKIISLQQIMPYIISGVLLGLGWLSLFYGFKHTSISSAVIIYNMCPIYVMIAAPFILKEKIRKHQFLVIAFSFFGLYLIVGNNLSESADISGVLLSGLSGVCYAIIVLINRSIKNRTDNQTATFIQILTATIVLLPFIISGSDITTVVNLNSIAIGNIILLGVIHTSLAYSLFFSVYDKMKSTEIVAFSFLEPLFSIIMSILFIGETLNISQIIGGIIILGATYAGEVLNNKSISTASPIN